MSKNNSKKKKKKNNIFFKIIPKMDKMVFYLDKIKNKFF